MAATQAENQQNEVNCEKVQSDQQQQQQQQHHLNVRTSLLQNGTDKSGVVRGGGGGGVATVAAAAAVANKGKSTAGKSLEMSQYRQDGGGGGGGGAAQGGTAGASIEPGAGETEPGPGGAPPAHPHDYPPPPQEPGGPPGASADGHGYGYGLPAYGRDGEGGGAGGVHAFGPRHSFGGAAAKQPPGPAGPFPHQQRFVSGQSLSQPTGPTPTLNQLLQSSHPIQPHRYQNSYGHADQPYNQAWPPQKPPYGSAPNPSQPQALPPAQTYRNQPSMSPAYGGSSAPSPGYGEGRSGWGGGPPVQQGQHGPGSPGPPSNATPVSQPSPQPPSHSPGPGMPPSPQQTHQQQQQQQQQQTQHQGFPTRPAQPTTPNAHAPDAADLSGGNSNDSSGGPAPGTPNSQGMRPTPSPTGSTGSRSMSPAVGQQSIPMPPRPSSGQSDSGGPTRMSHSPMANQGSYPVQHSSPHPAHVHAGYKGHPGMIGGPQGQQMPLYQPNQQYAQSGYPPRPQTNIQGYPGQGYGPPSSQPPPNNMSPQQYPNRSSNHMSNSQFAPYQQSWQGPVALAKGNGPPQAPSSPSPGPPRPPHYLKQHLQHKMNFGNVPGSAPPSPSPPQNYHMGPPPTGLHHSGMGPPPSMGPPNIPPTSSPLMANSHSHDGPMPPPSSTPNSHTQMMGPEMMDNGITTTAQGGMSTHVTTVQGGSVTSVVTTGPDGTPIDEGSQQSTLSNASAASGEDPQCTTPKSNRKNDMGHYSHPTTPQSTVPSPGAASMNSMHEDYGEISSPSWPRTPASPVFNSHVPPPDTYRSKKTDSLGKLYEMDDSPDRRSWLDKLLAFMEERRTPITTCPTISKNPLDLFRLYAYVKDRGGFMEVTKNKTWKDIAGMLGIGASSSAAYTLRKHYTKNLLAYECQFDRGGIDPQPIINQVEASSKKKGAKAASVPSPGSSNSQDSFPPPGSGGASMDGYGYGYPPGGNPDYNAPQRPSSQSNAPSPHGGSGGANHLNNAAPGGPSPAGGAADNVSVSNPFDDVSPHDVCPPPRGGPFPGGPHPPYPSGTPPRPQGQGYSGQGGYNQYPSPGPGPGAPPDQYSSYSASSGYPPAVRPVYPPYSGDSGAPPPPNPNSTPGPPASGQDPYNRYSMAAAPGSTYSPRPAAYSPASGQPGPPTSQPPAGPYNTQSDYYRPDQQGPSTPGSYPGGPASNKNMPPPGPQPPRRHPDFAKDQQPYPQFTQQRPQMYAWSNNNQYRPPQYGNSGAPQVGSQQWSQGGGRPSGQWDRYPANNQGYQQPQQGQQQWSSMSNSGVGPSSPLRPPLGGPRPGKPFPMMPPAPGKTGQQAPVATTYSQNQLSKREITFPPDSVEATLPVLYRRKRLCRSDLGPVDPWRIIMSLRSGLLSESVYALDVLNVLLFDDSSIGYFGLSQWPGLLDIVLEHFQKSLSDIFDGSFPREEKTDEPDVDLGGVVTPVDPEVKSILLRNTNNYTLTTRKGYPVKMVERNEDIFILDHQREWDVNGDATNASIVAAVVTDPWQSNAEYILPTFQAEFGRIPFHRKLEVEAEEKKKSNSCDDNSSSSGTSIERESTDDTSTERQRTPTPEDAPALPKASDKKRRTRTLSDVISRIKKDTSEANGVLGLETTVKTDDVVSELKAVKCEEEEEEEQSETNVDLNVSVNGECEKSGGGGGGGLRVRDSTTVLKRRRSFDYEDEAYTRDEASLVLITESQDNIGKRCVCISNILRSLTFVPGNEGEFARSSTFLAVVGKLLLLHHEHPPRTQKTRNYDREEDADFGDSCSSLQGESEWWWDYLIQIRENILVCTANISGQIDFNLYGEEIVRPILDGLLHWAICPSASGQDPFASVGGASVLSPQRLALEALCKLCVTNNNVDLVIATPPFSRLERLCSVLTKHLCRSEDQVLREFSINLLHYLAAADSGMARTVANQTPCVSLLVAFIEQAEQSALGVANQHGIGALRDNPDSMGTSLDMLRRAAATLVFLARHPDNRPLLVQQESRLLALVMSQILDQQVALLLSKVLFQISRS